MVIGTDVADLLLDGHEPTSSAYSKTGQRIVTPHEEKDSDQNSLMTSVTADRSVVSVARDTMDDPDVTDRFRHLLLHGHKKVGHL